MQPAHVARDGGLYLECGLLQLELIVERLVKEKHLGLVHHRQ